MNRSKTLAIAAAFSALLVGGAAPDAFAVAEINVAPGKTLAGPGIAVHGYDPVAYFTVGKPVQGSAEFSHVHGGATYRFANAENLKAFKANPAQYVPAFGGYCAYGVAKGSLFDIDPATGQVADGKLYLNLNKNVQRLFNKDLADHIREANTKWPGLVKSKGK